MGGFFVKQEWNLLLYFHINDDGSCFIRSQCGIDLGISPADLESVVVIINVTVEEPPLLSKIVNTHVSVPSAPIATV
jgi:hypothetical protein